MKTRVGYHVLVVMDHDRTANLALIDALIHFSDDLSNRVITLLCYCPASYWEHAGIGTKGRANLEEELAGNEDRYESAVQNANNMFDTACKLLEDAGVPSEKILHRMCFKDANLTSAVVRELQTQQLLWISVIMILWIDLPNAASGKYCRAAHRQSQSGQWIPSNIKRFHRSYDCLG